jgi:hypothetical protein
VRARRLAEELNLKLQTQLSERTRRLAESLALAA